MLICEQKLLKKRTQMRKIKLWKSMKREVKPRKANGELIMTQTDHSCSKNNREHNTIPKVLLGKKSEMTQLL